MAINNYLDSILVANYGDEVRDSIVAALEACYADATGNPNSYNAAIRALTDLYTEYNNKYNAVNDTIGTIVNADGDYVDVVKDTDTVLSNSLTLSPGIWIIIYGGLWSQNNDGWRRICIGTQNETLPSSMPIYSQATLSVGATESRAEVVAIDEETTYYMWVRQTSQTTLSFKSILNAIRIIRPDVEPEESESESIRDLVEAQNEKISTLEIDVSDTKQEVQVVTSSITTLAQQHSEDVYNIREDLAGNVQILRHLIDNRAFTIDENGCLSIG